MLNPEELLRLINPKNFEVSFKKEYSEILSTAKPQKIAVLATNEYEGIYRNGGIGTYYKTLSQVLADSGWYVILLLSFTGSDADHKFTGNSHIPCLKHIFSTDNITDIVNLQATHRLTLDLTRQSNAVEYHNFAYLYFLQALNQLFKQSLIYVEFQEMTGLGYLTTQAKQANILGKNCITAITMHSGHEWIAEANDKYVLEEQLRYHWQKIFFEQTAFENADLAFFPSYFLKSKVDSYGWNTSNAKNLPYFIPILNPSKNPSPVISQAISILDREKIPVIFFGRLEERKGLCIFIEAIKSLPEITHSQIEVLFIGKIIPLQSSALRHLNSQEYIDLELTGTDIKYQVFSEFYSEQAIDFIANLPNPVVCLASHQENFPNTGLEMGQLPVNLVVSQTGGFQETLALINRQTGIYWFKPRDSASLAEKLDKAIYNHQEVREIPSKQELIEKNQALLQLRLDYINCAINQAGEKPEFATINSTVEANFYYPKVTIGVTCYNLGKYLIECLASLEEQSYPNLEVIVLDDASTDLETKEIFAQAKDIFPYFRFVELEVNQGLGAARNHIISLAEGDYFLPLDADNNLLPFSVEMFVKAALNSQAKIVTCPMIYHGKSAGIHHFLGGSVAGLMQENIAGDACSLFDISIVKKFPHPESKDICTHDWEIMTASRVTGNKIVYFPYPLYEYRMRKDSMIQGAYYPKEKYYLRQYLAKIAPEEWNPRQLYMLLTACEQLSLQVNKSQEETQQLQNYLTHTYNLLAQANQRIAAMETSKFWQMRGKWFKIKRKLGLPDNE